VTLGNENAVPKLAPEIVTVVPPTAGPDSGDKESILGPNDKLSHANLYSMLSAYHCMRTLHHCCLFAHPLSKPQQTLFPHQQVCGTE
jgi:hypothetical protein